MWLAFSWLTVIPLPQPRFTVDRSAGRAAIAAAPVVGLVLGAAVAALSAALAASALPAVAIGALCVALLALVTRGMHLDGLADTTDGLGSMRPPEDARAVMRSGPVGPFGAACLAIVLLVQATVVGALASDHRWGAIVVAVALGRVGVVLACHRSLPASDGGFGALVGATQRFSAPTWAAIALVGSVLADTGQWWRGPVVSAVVLAGVLLWTRHCARRLGGVSGDVLGSAVELTTTAALVGFAL